MGSLGFRWPGSRGKLHQRSFCTSHCRCKESQSRCSRHISCLRKCRCCRLRANSYCSGTGNRIVRVRSVARQRSRVFLGPQQSWCSPNPLRQLQVRADFPLCFKGATANKERGEFRTSSAVIGACVGLMFASARMRQKKVSRSRFVKDVVSWPRQLVSSRSGQGSRGVPGPSVLRSIAPDVGSDCSSSDENEVPLA